MTTTDPTRIVADADVLAADLLVGESARKTLDCVRAHDWLTLLASDVLLEDTRAVIADLGNEALATAWYERIDIERRPVTHPEGDHPAIASALAGDAGHVLTFDDALTSAAAGARLQQYAISVRTPAAFAAVFDPAGLYEAFVGETYTGPDSDPRA